MAIMCNAKACVLVYGKGEGVPEVFPSHAEAVAMLNRYKAMPNMPQFKKMMSQDEFLTKCRAKLLSQAKKLQSEHEYRDFRLLQ